MKIKKVDDKPMIIHTKKKAKIHIHKRQEKELKVKPDDKQTKSRFRNLRLPQKSNKKASWKNDRAKMEYRLVY